MSKNESIAITALALALITLVGCKPRVDTSTDEKMKQSIEGVKKSLSAAQQSEFEDALKTLAFADFHDLSDLMTAGQTGKLERSLKERINGKTGEEIIAAAKLVETGNADRTKREETERRVKRQHDDVEGQHLEAERKAIDREEAVKDIEGLRAKLTSFDAGMLGKFNVERSRYYKRGDAIGGAGIELEVRNGTGKSVSRAYFHATLVSPVRAIPWVDDDFNYPIAGGLESGEAATWKLSPNMFGEWSKAPSDRDDLILIVRPVNLEGADGKTITGEQLTVDEVKRLRSLVESTRYNKASEVKASLDALEKGIETWRKSAVAASANSEAKYLREKKAVADNSKHFLAGFVILKSQFNWDKDEFSHKPNLDLTIRNDTGTVISRFYCHGVLTTTGRETPWVSEDFNYSVSGGIQPGETQRLGLAPNQFGKWGTAPQDRSDMVLNVSVTDLEGPDEKTLAPSDFSETEAHRLLALEKMIGDGQLEK